MSKLQSYVSLAPYFRVPKENKAAVDELIPIMAAKANEEPGCLYYEWAWSSTDDTLLLCREAYVDAAGMDAHEKNLADYLPKMKSLAKIERCECHGPAAEIEKLKAGLDKMGATSFVLLPHK